MLLLTFRVAQDLYAVDVSRVVEVVPRIDPRPIPRSPEFLAGLFGYRGRVVPAIDLGLLLGKARSPCRLSTRVILVEARKVSHGSKARAGAQPTAEPRTWGRPAGGGGLLLGLIAEQVNDVIRVDQDKVVFPSMRLEEAPYLGAMIHVDPRTQTLAQLIDVDFVLPPAIRDAMFGGWEKTDEQADASPNAPGRDFENGAEAEERESSQEEIDLGVSAR